jgi:hypothetical protein
MIIKNSNDIILYLLLNENIFLSFQFLLQMTQDGVKWQMADTNK